jgi:SOS-response transcriptional repressor LexA
MKMSRAPLTETQKDIYDFIVEHIKEHRYAPTIREMQEHFRYRTQNTIVVHLNKLRKKGYITSDRPKKKTRHGVKARTIQLVDDVVGIHYIKPWEVNEAVENMRQRGYKFGVNEAVELLKELNIFVE